MKKLSDRLIKRIEILSNEDLTIDEIAYELRINRMTVFKYSPRRKEKQDGKESLHSQQKCT